MDYIRNSSRFNSVQSVSNHSQLRTLGLQVTKNKQGTLNQVVTEVLDTGRHHSRTSIVNDETMNKTKPK